MDLKQAYPTMVENPRIPVHSDAGSQQTGVFIQIGRYLELVRFSHTAFALPFALASLFWASAGWPSLRILGWVLLAMITCRNAAMAFNRLVDRRIDAANPRTKGRHLPAGLLKPGPVWVFFGVNAALFIFAAWSLNPLAFMLSGPTLALVCFYSLTKRFTWACHLFLGVAIGISPLGAWVAATGSLDLRPALLGLSLALWIGGFDIIYATQDEEFDRKVGLRSLVVRLGTRGALKAALVLHGLMIAALVGMEILFPLGLGFRIALAVTAGLLVYLHFFRTSASLDSMNRDFFLANAAISCVLLVGIVVASI